MQIRTDFCVKFRFIALLIGWADYDAVTEGGWHATGGRAGGEKARRGCQEGGRLSINEALLDVYSRYIPTL